MNDVQSYGEKKKTLALETKGRIIKIFRFVKERRVEKM